MRNILLDICYSSISNCSDIVIVAPSSDTNCSELQHVLHKTLTNHGTCIVACESDGNSALHIVTCDSDGYDTLRFHIYISIYSTMRE